MAASFASSATHEGTESPSAQLLGDGSPPLGSESAADDHGTDPNMSPSKRKGGRQPADNSDETKERHAELYRYYKANPGMSQAKLADWYSNKFTSTMSQCTVSQVLKKQKLLNGEEIAEPRPRPGKRKSNIKAEDFVGESRPKKPRGSDIGTPIGTQTIVYTPSQYAPAPSSFQAVNTAPHSSYPPFASPSTPVSLANAALSHTEGATPTGSIPFRPTDPSKSNQQPFSTGPNSRPVVPMLPQLGVSTPAKNFGDGKPTTPLGGAMVESAGHRPDMVHALQVELEGSRRTVSEYQKIVQKQESLIDSVLNSQRDDREKIKDLEHELEDAKRENRMYRDGVDNDQITNLLNKIEKLTRDLEDEKDRNKAMVELWVKEENQLKDLLSTRSSKFPLGADMKH